MNKLKVSEHLRSSYEDYYTDGISEWRWLRAIDVTRNIQSLCKNLSINSVIEIGAGEGSVLKRLSDLDFAKELYALEISPTGIETIKNRNIHCLKECSLFDGYDIPYENKKFDLAVLSHVIEHIEYPRQLLYEAKRIAKYIFVQVPLEDTFRRSRDFVLDTVGHINFYSPKTIRLLIQTCNFRVIDQRITTSSKEFNIFDRGKKGLVKFYIKESLLRFSPLIATKILIYNSALICEDNGESQNT